MAFVSHSLIKFAELIEWSQKKQRAQTHINSEHVIASNLWLCRIQNEKHMICNGTVRISAK